MPYRAPLADFRFLFDQVVGFDQVAATDLFAEATPETVDAILTEAGKLCEDRLGPAATGGRSASGAIWKMALCAPPPVLPKGIARLSKAAGCRSPRARNLAAWVCRWP